VQANYWSGGWLSQTLKPLQPSLQGIEPMAGIGPVSQQLRGDIAQFYGLLKPYLSLLVTAPSLPFMHSFVHTLAGKVEASSAFGRSSWTEIGAELDPDGLRSVHVRGVEQFLRKALRVSRLPEGRNRTQLRSIPSTYVAHFPSYSSTISR
jgi:hypothetical protein